ncbi:hypothetical protein UA08_01863 [Talaromyces atroroseus]|uniref:xyloglucan-specific endo-beta-1,4-glucanase n=1 Tax=Talaromyces atroroseus TaxID=1441469 RepID=A0A1Q5QBF8_TALAT|nr:hypothetical protein UA08_01863 [Talaromyces atroroseus]OKL63287.1 hypothetical protein UA08_01863 [Talaromyces atroroseus]
MAFRWIVNAGLVAIPVGTTLGVLFGIDAQRQASGEPPLFTPTSTPGSGGSSGGSGGGDSTGGGGGSSGSVSDNGIVNSQYCQLSYGVSPPSKGENYTLNPNQWGVEDGVSGLCLNVTTFNNETYPTNTSAPAWSATWKYAQGPETQPVWAFPNIMVDDGLPVALSDLSAIDFDLLWTYTVGNTTSTSMDTSALDGVSLNANVAIDMFLDANATKSSNSSGAEYEIMVWFGRFGDSTYTIGNTTLGVIDTYNLNGTEFDLYYGKNGNDQNVFTWLTAETTSRFTGDLLKLITELTMNNTADYYPSGTDYLGYFSFGSEAYFADDYVTFNVPELSIDIQS